MRARERVKFSAVKCVATCVWPTRSGARVPGCPTLLYGFFCHMSLVCLYLHPQRPPPPRLRASLSSRVAISPSRLLRFESSEALEEQPAVARTQSGIWSVRRASRTRRARRAPHASARPSTCPSLWRQATLSCFKECHSLVPLIKVLSHLSYIRKPDIYVFKVPRHLKSHSCRFIL